MSKRSGLGKSMYVRYWGNPLVQPKFKDKEIQRGMDLAKRLSK